jgi:threonine dehydrogenase-like Zn-dependent dehydrogenase
MVKDLSIGDRVLVIWGYHASHCIVKANQLVKIDDDRIDPLEAAFVFIASFPLAGLRKTRLEIGESVLVMGLGLLGVLAVRLARLAGGVPVIAADIREDRRKAALELGADYAFSPESPEFPAMEQSTTPTLLILILTCKGHFDYTDPRTSYGAPQYSRY